ncbi:winged helix-turn-helix transcriptional regulator [Paenibacillus alvei]|uniref:winged helix-turn-helix transcriptional regulator n=1 Tax=Paenibacillus alvei TaxID=44250 RepID=UPI000386609A|nr:helix-turn-helix domain-containing protein [Paenibacillus alvei]EPY12975.1 transcriptional regulator [Paenibacillus alvei A6-6i-x]
MTSPSMYEMNGKQYQCAIELAVSIISGRWKPTIICKLFAGKHRYGELKKGIVGINHKMLAEQLKELEAAGIIHRHAYPEVPPKVEYELTELGMKLKPIIDQLQEWGELFQLANPREVIPAENNIVTDL